MTARHLPLAMCVVGARPNLVKIAPILSALKRDGRVGACLVHTGQHYDPLLSKIFFDELDISPVPIQLRVGSGTHGAQIGAVMTGLEEVIADRRPDMVVTVGDINSTVAAALVAAQAGIPQAHVEAGLRSGDPTMPEEVNRVVTDRLADVLLTHSAEADENLLLEGADRERIHLVGNVMIDTLLRLQPHWQGAATALTRSFPKPYGVVTLHRPSSVDDPMHLERLMWALSQVAADLPLVFPIHPRTRTKLRDAHHPNVLIVEPLGYMAFLDLVEHAQLVLTDSGGIQEETTVLGVPCLTLRDSTERPVTIRLGTNLLIGREPAAIVPAVAAVLAGPAPAPSRPPMWDGHAGERIATVLADRLDQVRPLRLST